MERIAAEPQAQGRLRVLHVAELPQGWLGKPNAMTLAATGVVSDWLLFTDADVIFAPAALRVTLGYATSSAADHFTLFPTLILRGWAEKMLIGFFQCVSALGTRAWKIADPRAKRDYVGVGAFSLIRRPVYETLGGYAAVRMEVLEDIRFGYLVKQAGFAQRVAFGRNLVCIRWAESAWGMLANLTKNLYAVFRFRASLLLGVCAALFFFGLTPFLALIVPGPARWAGVITLAALFLVNLRYWRQTGVSPLYVALLPVATLLFVWTILRSMLLVLRRNGVLWRGTLYPLKELRRQAGPLW